MKLNLESLRMKVKFDPNNAAHVQEYSQFLRTKRWKNGCRFILEWPFFSIPDMIQKKLVEAHLKTIIRSLKEHELEA